MTSGGRIPIQQIWKTMENPQGQPDDAGVAQLPPQKPSIFNPQMLSTLGCHPLSKKDSWFSPGLNFSGRKLMAGTQRLEVWEDKLVGFKWWTLDFSGVQRLGFWWGCAYLVRNGFLETKSVFSFKGSKNPAKFCPAKCSSKYHRSFLQQRFEVPRMAEAHILGNPKHVQRSSQKIDVPFSKLSEVPKN